MANGESFPGWLRLVTTGAISVDRRGLLRGSGPRGRSPDQLLGGPAVPGRLRPRSDEGERTGRIDVAIARRFDGYAWAFVAVAGVMIVAGGLVAAINSAAPFAHGSWLAAYLVLVGGVAQLLLGVGCLALPAPRLSARLRGAQLGLWNAGNAAVAAGVLTGAVGLVIAGSVAVLAAVGGFAVGGGAVPANGRGRVILYRIALVGLAGSVVIGSILAGTQPGR